LHSQAAGRGLRAVIRIKPAGDGVAAKADHAAAVPVHFGDQRLVHQVELARQLLRAALEAQFLQQGRRQRRKAGDIGE
jgi:hypothetical protein